MFPCCPSSSNLVPYSSNFQLPLSSNFVPNLLPISAALVHFIGVHSFSSNTFQAIQSNQGSGLLVPGDSRCEKISWRSLPPPPRTWSQLPKRVQGLRLLAVQPCCCSVPVNYPRGVARGKAEIKRSSSLCHQFDVIQPKNYRKVR